VRGTVAKRIRREAEAFARKHDLGGSETLYYQRTMKQIQLVDQVWPHITVRMHPCLRLLVKKMKDAYKKSV
jgi:hypothetical protein